MVDGNQVLLLGAKYRMRTLFLSAPGTFEYRETDPPDAPPGWARIRMRRVGICGSDVHYYTAGRIGDQIVEYPHVLGHEGCGRVAAGSDALAPDTPVYVEPAITCGTCAQCRLGRENTCLNIRFMGNPSEQTGCMSDEIVVPERFAFPLPDGLPLDEAMLLEPLCIGTYAVKLSRFPKGGTAAIVGAGPIGLCALLGLSEYDPSSVLVSEPIEARRSAALALGAQTAFDPGQEGAADRIREASDDGVDVAFECAGTQESIHDAARMLKPGGMLALIGIPAELDWITLDPNWMRRREIAVVNVRRQCGMVPQAMDLLKRRRDAGRVMVTHRFPPTRAKEAFELVRARADGVIKAVLEFPATE